MLIVVNSKEQEIADGSTVERLLDVLGMAQKRVAVEVNQELVMKAQWADVKLQAHDRVEIVSFVGGG